MAVVTDGGDDDVDNGEHLIISIIIQCDLGKTVKSAKFLFSF